VLRYLLLFYLTTLLGNINYIKSNDYILI